jgi:hypothetical protein
MDAIVYIGNWVKPEDLGREIQTGDLVMMETLDDTLVVEISKIKDNELWHFNNWIIPRKNIVAIKQSRIDDYRNEENSELTYYCKDCDQQIKSGGNCPLKRTGVLTPCSIDG